MHSANKKQKYIEMIYSESDALVQGTLGIRSIPYFYIESVNVNVILFISAIILDIRFSRLQLGPSNEGTCDVSDDDLYEIRL